MSEPGVMLITGTRKGIGRHMARYYVDLGYRVFGCSRGEAEPLGDLYTHATLDVSDEDAVKAFFYRIRRECGRLDVLINNAGIASMNHALLTPLSTVENIFRTNTLGTFLFSREAAKLMRRRSYGRVVNFSSVATPLDLDGEAAYASSKAAVVSLTRVLARELAPYGITVNAVGPTPVTTDLIRGVPQEKMDALVERQAIRRMGEMDDVTNAVDFFIRPESGFVTGQVLYLGGVN